MSPPPPRPKQEREAPEKDSTNNIPVTTLREVRVEILFLMSLPAWPRGIAMAVTFVPRQIAILQPPLPWARSQDMHRPRSKLAQPMLRTGSLVHTRHHLITTPSQ